MCNFTCILRIKFCTLVPKYNQNMDVLIKYVKKYLNVSQLRKFVKLTF
jgi:hypothetical protein